MNERIHRGLDGEALDAPLTGDEENELAELEALVDASLGFVRESRAPDVESSVMARIAGLEKSAASPEEASERAGAAAWAGTDHLRTLLDWIWRTRTVRIRPALLVPGAAVAALAIAILGPGPNANSGSVETGPASVAEGNAAAAGTGAALDASPAGDAVLYVRFELDTPDAASVSLAGSFTDWQPRYRLAETAPGRWTVLVPLPPGVHDYAFVVNDERWVPDPDAIQVDDGFGGVNSRIALLAPEV